MTVAPISAHLARTLERVETIGNMRFRPARVDQLRDQLAALIGTPAVTEPADIDAARGTTFHGGTYTDAASVARASERPRPGGWAEKLPAAGVRWAPTIEAVAAAEGVDPALLAALVWTESNFDPAAVSSAGARGLGQLMPGTANSLGVVDNTDPVGQLTGAARYLREQLDRFGTVELALAAYNAGPGRVAQHGTVPPIAETQTYLRRVTDRYQTLRS